MDAASRPPSVDALARSLAGSGLPHPLLVDIARESIAVDDVAGAHERVEMLRRSLLQRVVNATGVLLHTNLGRAPYPWSAPGGYANLELDLASGERGSRQAHAPTLLARACGAEAALVVNNARRRFLLVLAALAEGRGAVVSRGELVEIGGGFRVPEVMAQSGAPPRRGRHDEPHAASRLRACGRCARPGDRHAGPPVELPDRGIHRDADVR